MRARPLLSLLAGVAAAAGSCGTTAGAQGVWTGPQPPCEIQPRHRLVTAAVQHLKVVAESPYETQRESHLTDAQASVVRAISEFGQGDNPAAWYFLGRYYTYRQDAAGADSSFSRALALAPQCAADIDRYRGELAPLALTAALAAWQRGALDSAAAQFRIAASLQPANADVRYYMARMYAGSGQLDQAARFLAVGDSVGGGDPAYERQRGSALIDLARGYEAVGMAGPAVQNLVAVRLRRDSLLAAIARDSTLLAELVAEWAGKPLRPEVQQAVQRDSTLLARRLGTARQALPAVAEAVARDSAAAWQGLGPALGAYERYVEAVPDDARTLLALLRAAATAGATGYLDRGAPRVAALAELDLDELARTGLMLVNSGQHAHAARLLEAGLARNAFHRTSLFLLTRAYYTLADQARCLPAARRLMAVDPLNPQSVQMMAAAWDLAGQRDSAQHYLTLSQSGIGWAVNVAQFVQTETASVLNGSVSNIAGRPLEATDLAFEFLAADGSVVDRAVVPIPALQPGGRHALSVRVEQGGAVAWRYRREQ